MECFHTQKISKGFTLVELMIVIGILAIIASIAIPVTSKTAKLQEASNNLALRIAKKEYFLENNSYFAGTGTANLETNSGGFWKAVKGSDGAVAFNYVITTTS